ncbi:hypothetical protein VIN01S_25730 [Vibrio inusitatus NBRC 102082]|uniref:DUF1800 domain-containing protein n=1 Tax=Vibrio inusitatus NBRC 102082 TaxID=1219070 RepID=A0A4Y3HX67_9VIBR|nr:DUF1800 family protein [Vibrio inusitatus]GEA51769.1 hypothetical protein VIN01S_25730 [Vibrio inusitatus NBRC 102082]
MITPRKAHQVLLQATMGFKSHDLDNLNQAGSIENWISLQSGLNGNSLVARQQYMAERHPKADWTAVHQRIAYTDILLSTGSVLRNRIAYILTQLFVVSVQHPELSRAPRRIAISKYYDNLAQNCFGNFRELLKIVSTSPVMGEYLTFLENDYKEGVAADENYARELMQLFTIGPVLLEMDGSTIEDGNGRPVSSYSQEDIEQAAKIMTGWGINNDDWLKPLREKQGAHNPEAKAILGRDIQPGGSAEEDLDQLIDILCDHQNITPFIAKFFIQKMVTSNPSPDYIERVAKTFKNSGLDMLKLVEAILTDDAANYENEDKERGLIRDPLITLSHAMRGLNLTLKDLNGILPDAYSWKSRRVICDAPSVFYYYQPDESPSDERFVGLNAPEFKIYNWDDIYHYYSQVTDLAVRLQSDQNAKAYMNRPAIESHFSNIDNQNSIENLINEIDLHLFARNMSESMKNIIRDYMDTANRNNLDALRVLLIQIIMSPEFMTQG